MGIGEYIWAVLGWWVAAIAKFVVTPYAMMFAPRDWSFMEIVVITASGASLGVFIFYNFGEQIFRWIERHRKHPPKRFNRFNRFIAKIKAKYGLKGLLLICGVISVPIASLLAARYFRSNTTLPLLIMGFWIWTILLTSLGYLFQSVFA